MDEVEEIQQNNMISNLPLLFANGYPTSLEKITEAQLEQFIPFMVQCSLGHINLQAKYDFNEPEWWPEDVAFTIPFSKPKKFLGSWKDKMKDIVNICYQFHRSVFLLRFCKDLATFEHASLRFINNYNSTTSLFDRRSNKLLVTFRNENMSYDQPQRSRKCLLNQKCKRNGKTEQQIMVEPAPFDIYLCEYCDAELYSEEALKDHEKTCSVGDVIICDSPEPTFYNTLDISQDVAENNELRVSFLLNFNLQRRENISCIQQVNVNNFTTERKDFILQSKQEQYKQDIQKQTDTSVERLKRPPRRNRAVHSLSRCPAIPLSSPAGQLLIKTSKTVMTQDYLMERLDRIERFCHAPILTKGSVRPKYLFRRYNTSLTNCTFKKPQECSERQYVFPRRQFSQKHRAEQFSFVNSLLIKKCRPMTVRLKKIPESEIKHKRISTNTKLNIKLTRDTTRSSNWKISSSPSSEIIVDTIDLCSSDEEGVSNKNEYAVTEMKLPSPLRIINCRYSNKPLISKFTNHLSSEVTLTPIRKAFGNVLVKQEKKIINPSLHVIAANTTRPAKVSKNATLGATMEAVLSNNNSTPPKPLQPSVFFFSNYTSCPISIVSSSNNEIFGRSLENNFQTQNQENHLEKKDAKKSSTPSIPISSTPDIASIDWFPKNVFPATISSINNNHRNEIAARSTVTNISIERSSKSLPLIQCKRIISIDLTS